ncbi:NAD(P)/FAD-dependent oxidoreductase [Cupriavidus basilensis]|uniref:NAD(P)/FAD-dependent oxidoreductase n=1 Tax=Cupriavidus basilensis TaxID=68895 RepID=UPI0023E88129|nr:FAD-binding oxidoreductase [Cupriavidus basilensis]MDF3886839.1 FAD-binding oxidoreductase [Cupriavidus basilensis]
MQSIHKRPAIDGDLGWYESSPSRHSGLGARLKGEQHFDVAIVGAGFTGISLARRLAEIRPQARIALIDALEIGQGTSGRNAGFLIDVPHNVDGGQPDAEYERQLFALNNLAIGQLRSLKERYRIDCGWHDAGKYMSAHEEGNLARLECFADALKAAGFEYEVVEGQALSRRLGTSYYKAAVYTPGNVLVNPAALVRGLAAALPESVTLFTASPVVACDYGPVHTLTFLGGTLRADVLALTVGSFSEAFGRVGNRLASLFTYASLTEPLSGSEVSAHFNGVRPWGTTSAHPAGTTVRYTPDGRIFVRNTFHVQPALRSSDTCLQAAWVNHRRSFEARFPSIAGKRFEYTWGGLISMTLNHHSVFRKDGDNFFSTVGCNGVGVVKGTYLGHFMAEYMNGMRSRELDFIMANSLPGWMPPEPFKRIGASLRLRREVAGAGGDV